MVRTISLRVKHLFFWPYVISLTLVLLTAWGFLEHLEKTMLEIDKQAEIEHFLNRHETDKVVHIKSALLTLTYLPTGTSLTENLPVIFNDLPIPYEGEVDFLGKEYMVITNHIPEGTYFMAKDLSLFSKYEHLMVNVLLIAGGLIIILGYGLSLFISARISRPIQQLTQNIQAIKQGQKDTYLPTAYKDLELSEISSTFNHYLHDIDLLIARERSLISMASHELRTPIAVIMGAAQVIESRQQLRPDDNKTLQRIISAAETMSTNVQALLTLVREANQPSKYQTFSLTALVHQVIADVAITEPSAIQRIDINTQNDVSITSNKSMTQILVRNLINNALTHNQGKVSLSFTQHYFEVQDQGVKLSPATAGFAEPESTGSTGLGLYIVSLICNQLGWQFTLDTLAAHGTCATVVFSSAER